MYGHPLQTARHAEIMKPAIASRDEPESALTALLASIDLANNGYLFAPSMRELETAHANPEVVDVRGGRIYRKTTPTEYFPVFPQTYKPRQIEDNFDYEAAILSRQSRALFD